MDPALEGSAVLGEGGSDSTSWSPTRLGPCGEGNVLWIFTDFLSKPQMPGREIKMLPFVKPGKISVALEMVKKILFLSLESAVKSKHRNCTFS